MKYLKTYNEAIGVKLNSELKSMVDNFLIDLKHAEFDTKVSQIDYHSQKEKVKVTISRSREFTYNDIKPEIESIWSYLNEEGFEIEHFTCVEYWEDFEEPDDEFTIHQKGKGYYWSTGEDGKIKSIDTEFQKRPSIRIQPIHDPDNFDRIQKWIFEIIFTKDKIRVDKTRRYLSTNEELDPQTYLSAADSFQRKHPQRAQVLRKYGEEKAEELKRQAEELKRLQEESYKRSVLEEGKKFGEFNLFFEKTGQFKKANCYFQFQIDTSYYNDALNDWLNENSNTLWLGIQIGIQPVTEKDLMVIEWFLGENYYNYAAKKTGILWTQSAYIKVSRVSYQKVGDKVEIIPEGKSFHFEEYDFNLVKCSDRRGADNFKKAIISLFHGDIDYKQLDGKYFKEQLNEILCENDEMSLSSSDYDNFIESTYDISLNKLYKTVDPNSILEDEN